VLALNGWPSLERPVIASFPVRQLRLNRNAWFNLNIEAEIRSILEHDSKAVSVVMGFDFYAVNDLPFDLMKAGSFASLAGTCNFIVSHCAS
jgi:hypothetical protein